MSPDKPSIPFSYNTSHGCLTEWLNGFSKHLQVKPENSKIEYPDNFASGFAKVHHIEPGLSYRIVDYTSNTDLAFTRTPANKFFLVIYFYQYSNVQKLLVSINDEIVVNADQNDYSAVLMTNSFASQKVELKKGTVVKGLTIHLSEEWLEEKIEEPETSNYRIFKEKDVFKSFLSAKSQKLLNEIFTEDSDSPTPLLYTNNRVLRLLEDFLKNILRMDLSENCSSLSDDDFKRILKIETLLENYASDFPKIENLARIALMSETKLKSIFKKAFGMGLYEYYQKNRMHKAKELLTLNRYSVSEVGSIIGYQNLSNFSNAFKKEFGYLPKNCDKIG